VIKRLTIVCLGALLTLSATTDAFGWGAVSGPRGGAAYRGPMGGAAVRTPSGAAAVRGPYGGAAARGPYGGTAYRAPVYGGGAVYRGPVMLTPSRSRISRIAAETSGSSRWISRGAPRFDNSR
jgi:uncharacterized membrane protein